MPDKNFEFYEWEEDEIKEWFKQNYEDKSVLCPVCKRDKWTLWGKTPLLEFKQISPVFPVICETCGYMNFHQALYSHGGQIKIPREGGTT